MFSAAKTSGLTGYKLNRSLRFRSSASAYLNKTFASAGNRQKWTWSGWVKRGVLGGSGPNLFGTQNAVSGPRAAIEFLSDNLSIQFNTSGSSWDVTLTTTAVYRDPSAWYHIVIALDTTQATAANRLLLYVNGVQVTSFSTASYPALNASEPISLNQAHQICADGNGANNFDGYLAEINFIDGQALTPTSFGAYNSTTGVWQPIKYTGTYGTNGFYLNFNNNASTTTLGYDTSGNGNNWTTNNISLTAGSTYDSMTDVPTLTSATVSNYPTWNPLYNPNSSNSYLSQANLNFQDSSSSGSWHTTVATIGIPYGSGKYYFEATLGSQGASIGNELGIVPITLVNANVNPPSNSQGWYLYWNGTYQTGGNGGGTSYSGSSAGDIAMVAYDAVNGQIWFGKNGTWFAGNPSAGTGASYTGITVDVIPFESTFSNSAGGGGNAGATVNFGQRPFTYTPPTGFVALNTFNLPTPTIVNGASYMAATTYTGNGANPQNILNSNNTTTGVSFQPDFAWTKIRSAVGNNFLADVIRGAGNILESDSTAAEFVGTGGIQTFNSNGIGVNGNQNTNAATYVAWQWQAGKGTTSSNTNGSITSTVSVNATAGFSVVTYTGNGTSGATVGHSLGVTPNMIILKDRSGGTYDWRVYHSSLTAGYNIALNNTGAQFQGSSGNAGYISAVASSTFTLTTSGAAALAAVNASGDNYVAYCWSQVAGFSKFGSYTGNGSTDGPFVYLGFRPRFLMLKRTDSTQDWYIIDTSRIPYNYVANLLSPDQSVGEGSLSSGYDIDVLSNGFKNRNSVYNASGATIIYAAFAENPFRNSLAR